MSDSITITDELVAEIASRMAEEGQKVSPVAIWSEVHTGSVVAVAASLRKWRETRTSRVPQVMERPALPGTVTDSMRDMLDRLWTSANDEAERMVAQRLTAMRQRVEDACNERDDALAELQNTVEELDVLQGRLDQLTGTSEAKVDAVAGLEEDVALAIQRADAAESRAEALEERVSALEAELERATSDLAAEREAHSSQERDVADEAAADAMDEPVAAPLEGEPESTLEDEPESTALETAHSDAVARLEGELAAIRAELEAEQEANVAVREEIAAAHAERDAAKADLDASTLELQNAQTQFANLTDARDADAAEIARLMASLAEAEERATDAQQRAAESVEAAAADEQVDGAEQASAAGVDRQALDALREQISRDAEGYAAEISAARENVKKWSEYASGLKQQLAQSDERMIAVRARAAGEASLSRRLATELSQIDPESEWLRNDVQQRLIAETVTTELRQHGYQYNAATGQVTRLDI